MAGARSLPAGVTSVTITVAGDQGGTGGNGSPGGLGSGGAGGGTAIGGGGANPEGAGDGSTSLSCVGTFGANDFSVRANFAP